MNKKYWLISYGYYYGDLVSYRTIVSLKTPLEFICDAKQKTKSSIADQFHITFAMEISEKEYNEYQTKL